MVDNRSAGALGIGGGINFKSGDISGTAAKTADDRASQGSEYFMQEGEEQENSQNQPFEDRSMQLRASLNSLALLNVVSVLQNKRKKLLEDDDLKEELIKKEIIETSIEKVQKEKQHKKEREGK